MQDEQVFVQRFQPRAAALAEIIPHSSAMATPDAIIEQIRGCTEFFTSQGQLGSGIARKPESYDEEHLSCGCGKRKSLEILIFPYR